jgi:transmembrane sensor
VSSEETSTAELAIHEDGAAGIFIRRLYGEWNDEEQAAFETRLATDHAFAQAYRRVEESWRALDRYAEAPELMGYRAEAIGIMRRANAGRWFQPRAVDWLGSHWKIVAAIAGVAVLGLVWQLSWDRYRPGEYRTSIGEQRIVELEDHTRITLDAATRLQVRFTNDTRNVRLLQGQAEFSVAKDPSRPFKVIAGNRTIVAVGTVFTVEYVDHRVHVAMLEGKVAVLRPPDRAVAIAPPATAESNIHVRQAAAATAPTQQDSGEIYLSAGEELQVARDGEAIVTHKADLEAATAWREGKVIFRAETLGEAVNRMNRYSHLQLEIDDEALAEKKISGVFEAGDTRGFVGALEAYFSVTADYADPDSVRLRSR